MAEEMEEVLTGTINQSGNATVLAVAETPEQRDERLKREEYARRNAEAVAERENILRRNKVIGPDETLDMDAEAAIRQRCCF